MGTQFKQDKQAHLQGTLVVVKAGVDELQEGEFEAILSTETLDRHGEHVSLAGMELPERTVRMYFNHATYGASLPIGTWTKLWKTADNKLMGRGKIDLLNEFEQMIYKKIKLGTLDSTSIGFTPKEYDVDTDTWTKSELFEASVVNEPANTEALVTSKQLGFTEKEFEKTLKVTLKAAENQGDDDKPEDKQVTDESTKDGGASAEIKAAVDDLNSRLGAVEVALKEATENPAKKNLVKIRLALKQVDQSVESANRIVKVHLKETQND